MDLHCDSRPGRISSLDGVLKKWRIASCTFGDYGLHHPVQKAKPEWHAPQYECLGGSVRFVLFLHFEAEHGTCNQPNKEIIHARCGIPKKGLMNRRTAFVKLPNFGTAACIPVAECSKIIGVPYYCPEVSGVHALVANCKVVWLLCGSKVFRLPRDLEIKKPSIKYCRMPCRRPAPVTSLSALPCFTGRERRETTDLLAENCPSVRSTRWKSTNAVSLVPSLTKKPRPPAFDNWAPAAQLHSRLFSTPYSILRNAQWCGSGLARTSRSAS